MKLNKILPHPVLGQFDAISGIVEIRNKETEDIPEIEKKAHHFEIDLKFYHENHAIHELVKEGKAKYLCEISCSDTLYRRTLLSRDSNFKLNIHRKDVRRTVEIEGYCVTSEKINEYTNPEMHIDYNGYTFDLDEGDLLIYFGSINFDADIQYEKLKAASSFMEIVPHEGKEDYVDYSFDTPKILIKLPLEDYNLFKMDMIRSKKEFTPIIHSSLVQNALIAALFNLKKYAEEDKVLWATTLKYRLENDAEINEGSADIDPVNIPKIVSRLLGNPVNRLLKGLEKLVVQNYQFED